MQRKFITNLALILLLNVLVKPFFILGIDAEILKQVEASSPGAYGQYFSLIGFTFICNIFLDLGIINFNTKNIAQHQQLLKKHFAGILTLRALLSFGYLGVIFIGGKLLAYDAQQFDMLGILAFNQILVSFILYFRSNLSGLLLFKQDSVISVLDRFLLIIICSVLLWGGVTNTPFKIEWFVYAQTVAYGITGAVAAYLVIRQTGKIKITWNRPFSFLILKESIPYALLILLMMIYYRSDSVMLERMAGSQEAAVYAKGFRFFEAINMVGFLFAGLLLPIFSKMIKKGKSLTKMTYLSFKIILSISLSLAVVGVCFGDEILSWRYEIEGDALRRTSDAFKILMWCFIANCTTYIFGTLLTANGSIKQLNFVALTGVFLNVGLNIYFIPLSGAYGAALASLITQGMTALAQLLLSFHFLNLIVSKKIVIQVLAFLSIVLLAFFSIKHLPFGWVIQLLFLSSILAAASFATGMISVKGIRKIMDKNL